MEFRKRLVFPLVLLALIIITTIVQPKSKPIEVTEEVISTTTSLEAPQNEKNEKEQIMLSTHSNKSKKLGRSPQIQFENNIGDVEKIAEIREIEVIEEVEVENVEIDSAAEIVSVAIEEVVVLPLEAGEKISYTEEDLELLAHLVFAEANVWYNPETERGEYCSDDWQSYVALVALNRVKSDIYPSNLHDVIFQKGQYACTWNGSFEWTPDERAYRNVRRVLEGEITLPENVLFQAEFEQGSGTYIHIGNTYFCYL